jgi:hypothetical protein
MPNAWGGADPVEAVDADDYELGTYFRAVVDITATAARIWTGPGEINFPGRKARIWSPAGAQLGIATVADNPAPGWTTWNYDVPVPIAAGTNFVVSFSSGGNEGALPGALNANVTSTDGNVVAVAASLAPVGNGLFSLVPTLFPNVGSGSQAFYGSDFVYDVGIGGNTAPVINAVNLTRSGNMATVDVNATDAETLIGASYTFNWGDGSPETTVNYPTTGASHVYTATGTYAILVTVTDANGLTDTAAVAISITVFPAGRELTFYDIPNILLDAISAELAANIGGPLNRACVVPGAIAWDECECGALYISASRWFLSDTFPVSQSADQRVGPCELAWLVGEVVIKVIRCAPTASGRNVVAPSCSQLDTAAKITTVDAYVTLTTALRTLCGLKQDNIIIDFSMGEQTASGPEGMCVGSELRVFIAVPR